MRICQVLINNDGTVSVADAIDYVGEHCATQLSITLNSELSDSSVSYYTLCFRPGAALRNPPQCKLTSDMILRSDISDNNLNYKLPAALTCFGSLDCQVNAHCVNDKNEVTEIIKSPVFRILFEPSISGDEEMFIEEAIGFTALIHTALAQLNLTIEEADELCDKINEAYEKGELNGPVIMPHVSEDGTLSWSNDEGFENPAPVNIKGPKGDKGDTGENGKDGINGTDAKINGCNTVTIKADCDLKLTQDGDVLTFSLDSVMLCHTLPQDAQDGDICLYSPANTLSTRDSCKLIYVDWTEACKALSSEAAQFYMQFLNESGEETGSIYATSWKDDDNRLSTMFDVSKGDEKWELLFIDGVIDPESSAYIKADETTSLTKAPDCFALPYFTEIATDISDITGDVFYAPIQLMLYRGGWYEFDPSSHSHSNFNTLDAFGCQSLDNPITDGDFNFGINTEDWNRLKFQGGTVLMASDGAVVQKVEEKEIDGKRFFRVTLNKPGLNLDSDGSLPGFFDIPVNAVEEKTDIGLNGAGLGLVLGGTTYDKIELTAETATLEPNTHYSFGEAATLTIEFAEGDTSKVNEYSFTFISGATPTVLTLPSSVKWMNELTVEANKRYEISIVDNIGLWCAVDYTAEEVSE